MKVIIRELEIGGRCEREMAQKREKTGNTLEEGVCVCLFADCLQTQHPHEGFNPALLWSEMDS